MKTPKWYVERMKARKNGLYKIDEIKEIKISIPVEEIKKFCNEHKLTEIYDGTDNSLLHIIEHLQGNIYLGMIPNMDEPIKNELCRYDEDLKSSFPKLFWEEYVYGRYDLSFDELQERAKELNKVRKSLDKHPQYQGISGEQLQEVYDHKLGGVEMDFSWRAWGALMAAYMNSKEKERKYHYMSFYM